MKFEREYASTDAIYFSLWAPDGSGLVTGVTLDSGDMVISKDGGAFANVTGTFAEEGNGIYSYTPAAADLQCKVATIVFADAESVCLDRELVIETYGHASAQHTAEAAELGTDGRVLVSDDDTRLDAVDNALTTIDGKVDAVPTAAANADAVWDEARSGHTTNGTFGQGVASVQGAVTGAVGSVTGNVGGNVGGNVAGSVGSVTGDVGGLAANAISDVQAALTAQGLTTTVANLLRVAALLSAGDWTRSGDTITLSDGSTLALTEADGVVTGVDVTIA